MTPNNINPNSANSDTKQEEHITFSVHDLIQTVIANWYWFVISVFVASDAVTSTFYAPRKYTAARPTSS